MIFPELPSIPHHLLGKINEDNLQTIIPPYYAAHKKSRPRLCAFCKLFSHAPSITKTRPKRPFLRRWSLPYLNPGVTLPKLRVHTGTDPVCICAADVCAKDGEKHRNERFVIVF